VGKGDLEDNDILVSYIEELRCFYVVKDGTLYLSVPTSENPTFASISSELSRITSADFIALGSTSFFVTLNREENALSVLKMGQNGAWEVSDQISQLDSWQVESPSKVKVVLLGETVFVIVASRGTHSLSVFQLNESGELQGTDHVYDTRSTRFANATDFDVTKFWIVSSSS